MENIERFINSRVLTKNINFKVLTKMNKKTILTFFVTFSLFFSINFVLAIGPSCDLVVNGSMVFEDDLHCDDPYGLIISADNLTINCDGYGIFGDGGGVGIYASGYSGITVENCEISNFETGIFFEDSENNTIRNNNINGNGILIPDFSGIHFYNTHTSEISGNDVSFNDYGIVMIDSNGNNLLDNNILDNLYQGVYLEASHNNSLSGGEIGNNNQAGSGWDGIGVGGAYLSDSVGNTISGVYMHDNQISAIYLDFSDDTTIEGNNIDENCGGESGVYLTYSDNALIQNNNITNGTGYGIEMYYSSDSQILNNDINNNTYDGVYIYGEGGTSNHLIEGNNILGNPGDGIHIEYEYNVTITNNTIECSGVFDWYYGIYIYESYDFDLGGNEISNCGYGIYLEDSDEITINEDIHGNYYGLYVSDSGDNDYSEGKVEIFDSEVYDNCEGIYLSSSYVDIKNTNFNNNICEEGNLTGIYVDSDSDVYLENGDFISNGGYGIYDDYGDSVYWTLTKDVSCENNDIFISSGWMIPLGGSVIAEDCSISVDGEELDLESGQQGFIVFDLETSEGEDTVGGEEYGVEAEVHTTEEYEGTLTVEYYNENPGDSGFSLTGFGKWVDMTLDPDMSEKIVYSVEEVNYSWDGVEDADGSFSGDDDYETIGLPWDFLFYGDSYSELDFDSNGNLWFDGYGDSGYEFGLTDSSYPVISAWNLDLSSSDYGEYGYEDKGDKVVFQWETETYDDGDSDLLNLFEVILYENGTIKVDYDYFDCVSCDDDGSMYDEGVAEGDGETSTIFGDYFGVVGEGVYSPELEGTSYIYTPTTEDILDYWILKIYYTDEELAESGLTEDSLVIEYYNETDDTWEVYSEANGNGGINAEENYVWANVTHFSLFGVFGSAPVPAPSPTTSTGSTSSGGGSSRGSSCITTWTCGEWSECSPEGLQTRACEKELSYCYAKDKPEESQECTLLLDEGKGSEEGLLVEEEEQPAGFFAGITGAAIGVVQSPIGAITALVVIAILLSFLIPKIRGPKKV